MLSLRANSRWSHLPLQLRRIAALPGLKRYHHSKEESVLHEELHDAAPNEDKLDAYIQQLANGLSRVKSPSILTLYHQYQHEAGTVVERVVPYEERPDSTKRADRLHHDLHVSQNYEGDGLVLVVHAQFDLETGILRKTAVCSGFVVNASVDNQGQGDTVITCAHTLEEIYRHLNHHDASESEPFSFSFIVPGDSPPRPVTRLLSSMPRSDVIALEVQPTTSSSKRLRSLPLTPFPVYSGTPLLTHLFGSPDPPPVNRSIARLKARSVDIDTTSVQRPVPWVSGRAWRRWGAGHMLGYRSYTGLELEAGISSVLPHILASILPTTGSSGGPLVNAETGCVVGMISGRRMDNRVEGERGWGCSSEGIFEMFSLPGFMPTQK